MEDWLLAIDNLIFTVLRCLNSAACFPLYSIIWRCFDSLSLLTEINDSIPEPLRSYTTLPAFTGTETFWYLKVSLCWQ